MKPLIKNYIAFFPHSKLQRFLFLAYPLLCIPLFYFSTKICQIPNILFCYYGICILIIELIFHYQMFAGLLRRDNKHLLFFRTSSKGFTILKKSLIMDRIRRFFNIIFLSMITYFLYSEHMIIFTAYRLHFLAITNIFLWIYLCIEIGSIGIEQPNLALPVLYIIFFLSILGMFLIVQWGWNYLPIFFVFILLNTIFCYGRLKISLKKMRRSYYEN